MEIGKNFIRNRQLLQKGLLAERQRQSIKKRGGESCLSSVEDKRQIGIKGHVEIQALYPNGKKEILLKEESNLVVRQAEEIMPFMTVGLRQMNYIELGDPNPAQAPQPSDLSLQQTTGQRKTTTPAISGNVVSYDALWQTTEANGISITEAGLFTDPFAAGLLFARKTFNPILKTNAFSLLFKWGIVFTVNDSGSGSCSGVSLLGSSTITSDYPFVSPSGGETEIIIPIDFTVGTKNMDVFLNGQRLTYNKQYFESVIGLGKGIKLIGFSLDSGDEIYVVDRKLA